MIEVLKQALEALEFLSETAICSADTDILNEAITSLRQAIAELESQEPARSALVAANRERDGWMRVAEDLTKSLRFLKADLDLMRSHQKNNVWYWQGDGYDHLESMGNDMVVVIHAASLREMLTRPSQRDELHERLAQPEQEPVEKGLFIDIIAQHDGLAEELRAIDATTPSQRTEQNFCPRCGKRTPDLTHIHTCTPPKEGT
jgi:hypothetical protein